MTHIKHQVGPEPTPLYHTPHILTLIQHMDDRKHKQTQTDSIEQHVHQTLMTSTSQWLIS